MNYQEFLDYIYRRHSGNVKLGLDRMLNILSEIGSPNEKLDGIHIAGTNGKGSTAAICESLLLNQGYTTGLNTSPHLVDYRERIRINGKNIELNALMDTYHNLSDIFEKYEASFFEITTAMAFYHFLKKRIDSAIFEVGLGGRLDGTNPFQADVSVITTISFDHPKSLGNSVEQIAAEKAGILKESQPVVLGKINDSPLNVIKNIAKEKNCHLYILNRDFFFEIITNNENGLMFNYNFPEFNVRLRNLRLNLLGEHQAINASIALTAFFIYLKKMGRKFAEQKIYEALTKVNWMGRMQKLHSRPSVFIDGAHNEEGVKSLIKNVKNIFDLNKRITFIVAILRDKKLEIMLNDICSVANRVVITKNDSKRAAEINDQVNVVKAHNLEYEVAEDIESAVKGEFISASNDDIIIITGSLYTISSVLAFKDKIFHNRC